ncbi:MAG: AcrR family transcriptional regulator [Yoonia sp.]|jgi:AcrR family transcriptional regulator
MKRRSLTTKKSAETALEFANHEGFEALSMRKLAGLLNVTAMPLYNYVAGKDALLELMLGKVVAEIDSPTIGGDWEVMMRWCAHSLRQVLLRHRWTSTLLISRFSLSVTVMRNIDAIVGCLVAGGFTYAQADWARNAIDSHVYGYMIQESNFPVEPDQYKAAAAQFLPMNSQANYPYMYEVASEIIAGTYNRMTNFDFGLKLVLSGLQQWQTNSAYAGRKAVQTTPPLRLKPASPLCSAQCAAQTMTASAQPPVMSRDNGGGCAQSLRYRPPRP